MDFLRDQIWQFVGVAVTVLGLFISVGFSLKQRSRKALMYDFEGTPLVSVKSKAKDKIQILYNYQGISDAYFLLLRVWNSGNVPLQPNDFHDPITFLFGTKAEILSCEVIETQPGNIKKKLSVSHGKDVLTIQPLLLNKGACIILKLVLSGFTGDVKAETLVAGLDRIQRAGSTKLDQMSTRLTFSLYPHVFVTAPFLIILNAVLLLVDPGNKGNIQSGAVFELLQGVGIILSGLLILSERLHWYSSRNKLNKLI